MTQKILEIADNFWNIRGSFKIGGLVEIGTHASLIQKPDGKFLFLDSLTLIGSTKRKILELTDNGALVEAVLNVHPFHTVHVERMHKLFPNADYYGSARHVKKFPDLPWQKGLIEDQAVQEKFADVFEFSIPEGVDYISRNENVHFSSVLVYHPSSKTIHSDDTLMCLKLPVVGAGVSFHPTLAQALEKRQGAAQDFRDWAEACFEQWCDATNICTAHNSALTEGMMGRQSLMARLEKALDKTSATLKVHERKFG